MNIITTSYELCSDLVDVVIDVSCIYGNNNKTLLLYIYLEYYHYLMTIFIIVFAFNVVRIITRRWCSYSL